MTILEPGMTVRFMNFAGNFHLGLTTGCYSFRFGGLLLGTWMEGSRGTGVWKQIALTLRCPFCIEGNGFRPMLELSGRPDGILFCSKCHHLTHSAGAAFKCECANCRNLNRDSSRSDSQG